MVCGSLGLNTDLKKILEGFGLKEGANSEPAHYVVEKAFVGQLEKEIFMFNQIFQNKFNKKKLCLERANQHDYFALICRKTNKGTKQQPVNRTTRPPRAKLDPE